MKHFFALLILLAIIGRPLAGYASCSGKFSVSYPDRTATGGVRTTNYNFGQSNSSAAFCPGTSGSTQLSFSPDDNGTLQITYSLNGVTTTLVSQLSTTAGALYTYSLPAATSSVTYYISTTVACSNTKNSTLTLALAPTLTLAASVLQVCQGGAATLTATGSSSGSYAWTAPGMANTTTSGTVANGVNTTTLSVSPTVTTTYTVTTTTACGATSSQQITVTVPTLTASSNRSTVCPGSSITLTAASSEPGTTYTWTRSGATVGSGAGLTLTPAGSGTYRVTTNNPSGCANTSFVDVPVTVAAATASVSQSEVSVTKGQPATITASSNLSGASYVWRSGSTSGTVVGTEAVLSVAPDNTTTYYVTATAGSCSANTSARVSVEAPLPVELSAFEARATAAGHRLSWTTAQEINCAYFRVEYSADGRRFTALGLVAGAGTSARPQQYAYLLAKAQPGRSYYRLAQVDTDGATHYSATRVLAAGRVAETLAAQVFPNPLTAQSVLRLTTTAAGPVSCQLYDALGRPVLHYTFVVTAGEQQLALPELPATARGLHLLRVQQGSQQQVLRLQLQ